MSEIHLVKYDAACRALAAATTVDEVKDLRDKASAIRHYARQANNRELEADATEIRLRAERRVGELMKTAPKAKGTRGSIAGPGPGRGKTGGTKIEPPVSDIPTLASLGVSKKLSSRAQRLASLPPARFEATVASVRRQVAAQADRVTANSVRSGRRDESKAEPIHESSEVDLAAYSEAGQKFGTIYADPPWQYGNQGTRAATNNHYHTMTVDDICALPIGALAEENAHLHLWTTNAFLFEAKRVLEAWGFEYKSVMVWCKPQMGIGNYWRVSHEFMLLGVRGDAPFRNRACMSWQQADRIGHSRKPELFRTLIEKVSPGPYLELFGRRSIPGWSVWGNQIERGLYGKV